MCKYILSTLKSTLPAVFVFRYSSSIRRCITRSCSVRLASTVFLSQRWCLFYRIALTVLPYQEEAVHQQLYSHYRRYSQHLDVLQTRKFFTYGATKIAGNFIWRSYIILPQNLVATAKVSVP